MSDAHRKSSEMSDDNRRRSSESSDLSEEEKQQALDDSEEGQKGRIKKVEFVKPLEFVDDGEFYKRRIKYADSDKYWKWVIANHYFPKFPPNFVSWLKQSRDNDYELEVKFYPPIPIFFTNICTHYYWDYLYLIMLAIWFILLGVAVDGFLDSIIVISPTLEMLPVIVMIVSQAIPLFGGAVAVVYYNDLAKFVALQKIQHWAISAVLISQYLEFAYYGGHNRLHMATKCRLEETRSNTMKYSTKTTFQPSFVEKCLDMFDYIKRFGKPARVTDELNEYKYDDDNDDDDDDGIAYFMNAEGKLVYINDDGDEIEATEEEINGLQMDELDEQQDVASEVESVLSKSSQLQNDDSDMNVKKIKNKNKLSAAQKLQKKKEKMREIKEIEVQEDLEKNKVEEFDDGVRLGEGGGFLERRENELRAKKEEMHRLRLERKLEEEKGCTDWWEWDCVICKQHNRRPAELKPNFDTIFVTKGVFFKHTVVALQPTSLVPTCENCFTSADYVPRLCNKHLIEDIEEPYAAFENYPISAARLPRHILLRAYDVVASFFFGRRNHPDSKLMANDWRLSIYLSSQFPEITRHSKKPEELYEIGEIVECRLQKKDWSRARITAAKTSRAYDLKYDSGDVVRLVAEKDLRLPPAKGWYAYRVELMLVGLLIGQPIGLFLSLMNQDPGFVFLPILVGSAVLLALRLYAFITGFSEYYTAGCLVLSAQSSIFILPLILFVVVGILGLNATSMGLSWLVVSVVLVLALVISLPFLYMKRVTFAFMLMPLIFVIAIGSFNASFRFDGQPLDVYASITAFPGVLLSVILMKYRSVLGSIWDVSLIIRPIEGAEFQPMWIIAKLNEFIEDYRSRREDAAAAANVAQDIPNEEGAGDIELARSESALVSVKD